MYPAIHLTLLVDSQREKMLFLVVAISKERQIMFSFFEMEGGELHRENANWVSSKMRDVR